MKTLTTDKQLPKTSNVDIGALSAMGIQSNTFCSTRGRVFDYYLCDSIGDPCEYTEWFNQIRNVEEEDIVRFHINSPGGNLYTGVQFVHVLSECRGHIEMHVEGACMSAASMIFMMGRDFHISPYAAFMFHNYRGGMYGKGNELINAATHDRAWSTNIISTVYKDFLTPEEIADVLADKDIWMGQEEVIKRLTSRNEKLQQAAAAAQQLKIEEISAALESVTPKKPAVKKKKKKTIRKN